MLLVCPKCVAQYEVDDQAIPENGREVQCANCEHIWFQDRIQMLSDKPVVKKVSGIPEDDIQEQFTQESEDIFEDLVGVQDVEFHTARSSEDPSIAPEPFQEVDPAENILSDDYDEDDEFDDDPAMELPEGGLEVDEDVLQVLRSEAAFASAQTKPISTEEINLDEPDSVDEEIPPVELHSADDSDDLTAFLDALADDVEEEAEAFEDAQEDIPTETVSEAPARFDPLSDLDAIRRQLELGDIGADQPVESKPDNDPEYPSVLPVEDGTELQDSPSILEDEDIAAVLAAMGSDDVEADVLNQPEMTEEFKEDIFAEAELEIDSDLSKEDEPLDNSPELEVDEFEEFPPRQAFRADGAGLNLPEDFKGLEDSEIEPEEEPVNFSFFSSDYLENAIPEEIATELDQSGSAVPAAAALGAMRPRSHKGEARVRNAEGLLAKNTKNDAPATPENPQSMSRPTKRHSSKRSTRPETESKEAATSRKELLPDVEELNSTLRGEEAQARTSEGMEAGEDRPATKSFSRSFSYTLLILALLVALYVMRPMIVSAVPTAALVLDPYVVFVDSIRLGIENLVGKLRG
ncbi:MAG: zinc-ribbon domain-containing protein [Rhodobacteraceae bacterium]|nr:zinc-ribbon domain-containing protein [Paracoccaceae bacterium]